MALQWLETMSTGVKEVDDAHKILIEWINKLQDAMKEGKGRQEVLGILDFLAYYAEQHFTHEEHCMNKYKCPAAKQNRKEHGEFLLYVIQMREKAAKEGVTWVSVMEINHRLSDWLITHIMKVDIHLIHCSKDGNYSMN
jgi:hemerythrin-like metal-binding protein